MMLPTELYKIIKNTMEEDEFPFENTTDFIILASVNFSEQFHISKKSEKELKKFIDSITNDTKTLIKKELMSNKLYGWKKQHREKLK